MTRRGRKAVPMIGRVFGLMYVQGVAEETTSSGEKIYICRCLGCDEEKEVRGGHLRSGKIVSCGSCSKRRE